MLRISGPEPFALADADADVEVLAIALVVESFLVDSLLCWWFGFCDLVVFDWGGVAWSGTSPGSLLWVFTRSFVKATLFARMLFAWVEAEVGVNENAGRVGGFEGTHAFGGFIAGVVFEPDLAAEFVVAAFTFEDVAAAVSVFELALSFLMGSFSFTSFDFSSPSTVKFLLSFG